MNISKVLKFLVAGIVIGAVLFFAGFGVMNLFKKDPAPAVVSQAQPTPEVIPVTPPTIQVTTSQPVSENQRTVQVITQGQATSNSPIKIKPLDNSGEETTTEGEPTQAVSFGTLTLSTINTSNSEPVNADFLIENSDSVAIALVKDTSTTTLSLPVGDYKITVNQGLQKVVRFLGVKDGRNGSEIFELDVAVLTDEAPSPTIVGGDTAIVISAPSTDVATTVQENSQTNPDQAQASPDTTEPSSDDTVSVNVVGDSADSSSESSSTNTAQSSTSDNMNTNAESANAVGGLRLSALTKQGKRPTTVSFYIQRLNGQNVENFKNVKTQQLTLPAGKYKVTAKTNRATLTKQVEVLATKGVHEIFMISDKMEDSQQASQTAPTDPIQPNSTASSTAASASSSTATNASNKKPGKLELFAQKANNNSPLKSNFYVQMPNGKMVASKVYVDSIGYKLPAGKYKVIVRATGYKNKTIMLNVRAGQTRREVFKLDATNQGSSNSRNTTTPTPAASQQSASTIAQPVRVQNQTSAAYGGLTVNILDNNDAALVANIVITKRDGTLVKQANGVASASFDLPQNEFLIRVTYDGMTTNHQVNIVKDKLAIKTISFDTSRMSRQERRRQRRERRERSQ